MPRFSGIGVASILFLATAGPGMAKDLPNPFTNTQPSGAQPGTGAKASATPLKPNSYYESQKSMSRINAGSVVGRPAPRGPY
jgi:hypothetical protein